MSTFRRFDKYKLPTEFLDGSFKHTIIASPSRVETWERLDQLGEGGFGTVHRERCHETGALRAVKEIKKTLAKSNEVGVLMQLSSYPKHFVQLMGWFEDRFYIYLAMEFLECGDLGALMRDEELSEGDARSVTVQVLEGLEIMHKHNLCHRDLKPGNILIARWMPLTIKIADFGVSKHFDGFTEGRTFTGSQKYMAPEIWGVLPQSDTSSYTTAVDVWSLGCMVYAMLTKEPPFPEPRRLIDYVEGRISFPPSQVHGVSPSAVEFMATLLRPLPADRATAIEARQHPWISSDKGDETVWSVLPTRRDRISILGAMSKPIVALKEEEEEEEEEGRGQDKTLFDPLLSHRVILPPRFGARTPPTYGSNLSSNTRVKTPPSFGSNPSSSPRVKTPPTYGSNLSFNARVNTPPNLQPPSLEPLSLRPPNIPISMPTVRPTRKGPKEDAMIAAASNGNLALVRTLVDKGADINSLDYLGRTPLIVAARGNHLELVKFLVERGLPVSQGNTEYGITPLHSAAEGAHLAVMKYLIENGANINEEAFDARTPLFFAAMSGNMECVVFLLKNGADIKHRTAQGFTHLHTAVEGAHIAMADYLIQLGEDVMEESVDGRVALDYAALSGNDDILRLLVENGADISHRDHSDHLSVLHRVAERGHLPSVVFLLEKGAHVNEQTPDARTPLYFACASKNVDLVKYLLQMGADIRHRSEQGYTSLHRAAETGHLPMMALVLSQGVDVMEPSNDNRSPLYFATLSGSVQAVQMLLENGADIRCRTDSGQTCLLAAAGRGHIALIDFFLAHGFGIDERDSLGYNALHFAAEAGQLRSLQHLLARGADLMSTVNTGATALSLAGEKGQNEIVNYILERLETSSSSVNPTTPTYSAPNPAIPVYVPSKSAIPVYRPPNPAIPVYLPQRPHPHPPGSPVSTTQFTPASSIASQSQSSSRKGSFNKRIKSWFT